MELKKFWVKNFKSLKDVAIEFPTKLTAVIGRSGSGKTALVEAFEMLRNARYSQAAVGIEVRRQKCRTIYELDRGKRTLISNCGSDEAGAVQEFLNGTVVIKDINWKAVRSLQPAVREERLLPDASNFLPFLYTVTGGAIPESLIEALRYVFPVRDMQIATDGDVLALKLTTEDGTTLTQATMPSGVLKTLIFETVLKMRPTMVVVDEFENSLDPEAQQFLIDELRSHDVYAVLTTHSSVVLDYAKTPQEVVMLRLVGNETKAWRLGDEVKEELKKHELTLSELIESGLLEPLVF
ncbi:MAG: AAA family ATPase [Pyrobaculum sp.]|jgi:predicted ATPase